MATQSTTYEIIVALPGEFYGARGGEWSNELGAENEFPTIEAAEAAIPELRAMGDEWATGIYAVREVGALYPEFGTIDEPEGIGDQDSNCPTEWEGRATRVRVTDMSRSTYDDTFYGWFLLEDIEGSVDAGQLWLDGDDESAAPVRSYIVESDPFDAALNERINAILPNY